MKVSANGNDVWSLLSRGLLWQKLKLPLKKKVNLVMEEIRRKTLQIDSMSAKDEEMQCVHMIFE